ncbi:MAG: hypothetical protein IRZ00_15780 [Gemmatimonadetes bacterium]|nr:hypothetical protein [Gemmatimonadota bacterium]
MKADAIEQLYRNSVDTIVSRRHAVESWLRRCAPRRISSRSVPYIRPGEIVRDAARRDGVPTLPHTRAGAAVTAPDRLRTFPLDRTFAHGTAAVRTKRSEAPR